MRAVNISEFLSQIQLSGRQNLQETESGMHRSSRNTGMTAGEFVSSGNVLSEAETQSKK